MSSDESSSPSPQHKRMKRKTAPKTPEANDSKTESSDDEVPVPDLSPEEPEKKTDEKLYNGLQSIICGYKSGAFNPKDPDSPVTFKLCAELAQEEIGIAKEWLKSRKALEKFHPMVLSALRLVYPNKKDEWFQRPFLKSKKGAITYWIKVLERRVEIWSHKANKESEHKAKSQIASLTERIRDKIDKRKAQAVSKTESTPNKRKASNATIVISSDSDEEQTAAPSKSSSSKSTKTAPPPESYTKSEIKNFKRVAKAIKSFDESLGHTSATCDFVDSEFSDGTGRVQRIAKSKSTWKLNRLNKACAQAATILSDRSDPSEPRY